jgi:hypothetical protein
MYPITELLLGGSIRTTKSGVLIENIDRVEIDYLNNLHIRGYVRYLFSDRTTERWTILNADKIDLYN